MEKDYTSPIYDEQREWIAKARQKRKWEWDKILLCGKNSEKELADFLENQAITNFWEISVEDWKNLVAAEKAGEEKRESVSFAEKNSIISDGEDVNDISIPTSHTSCWQKYKRYLLDEQHFLSYDVQSIEISSFRILQRLNSDSKGEATKGLVVGNVQSGKTANMAALMAMAADYGWNMFIVLSGTIENLREQTLNRLINDLNLTGCNLTWTGISHPSKKCPLEDKAQTLGFEPGNHNRYLTVCLKNTTRLKNLIDWLHDDKKSAEQMKILVIDDESDQAGINTKSIDSDERTRINNLIVNLVGNKSKDGEATGDTFAAMNYIGYTATPYANILNEAWPESLYPRDFISTLEVSKTYFGPQQIFGDRSSGLYNGLDIVRDITDEDVKDIKQIHDGKSSYIPESFEDAICWFLCCAAVRRYYGFKKPVSMLVHTSQKTDHHSRVHNAIKKWLDNSPDYIVNKCKSIWETETNSFTIDDLFSDYPGFAESKDDISNYPDFSKIEPYLIELIKAGSKKIMLGEDGIFTYSKGIHLCIDNYRSKGVQSDKSFIRLAYPGKDNDPGYATAFIVVGGTTLSRGLTIEGLVSTYFLRSTKQGDTLMQMGRWFGYRKGYELLPRVWLTNNAVRQFEFLSDLDSELRSCIAQMELLNQKPKDYAVVVKQSPSASLLRISAKNKIQGAERAQVNYSGMRTQTQLFIDDKKILIENYEITDRFIGSLGKGERGIGKLGQSSYVWRGVSFDKIFYGLLKKYHFHDKLLAFTDLDAIYYWISQVTKEGKLGNWNVVLYGIDSVNASNATMAGYTIKKVRRTRHSVLKDGTINIGVLTDPKEKVVDVDYNKLSVDGRDKYDHYKSDFAQIIRNDAGLGSTPSMVIYVVDKDSTVKRNDDNKKGKDRHDLKADYDLVGISLNIPGDRISSDYTKSIAINLEKFGLGKDIEDAEDDN